MSETGPALAVLAGALCLSASAILVALADVDAATTAVLRCVIAVAALIPLAMHERARHGPLSGRGAGWAIVAGVALGIDYAAWTASIYHVGAGISTVLINVQVIVLPLLAFVVDRERIDRRFVVTLPVMLLGISLVGGLWDSAELGEQAATGTLLGLVAGIGYGAYLFLTRRATSREPARMTQPLAWATASAAGTAAAIAGYSGGIHLSGITPRSWGFLVALALLGQVAAWLLIHHGSVRLEPATTGALLLIQPVLALALAATILAEHPTGSQLLGALAVLVAVAASNRPGHARRSRAGCVSRPPPRRR
ncbi:DMT family transporter [Saccharomonospora piscinae]|uniref:DMT family transporter n=1 Tax=Saccharomonospora piscinae TaxID=687388 RepID=UPI001106523F|nr:DMT family transporter [Saccharomonospora piscinae]TLW93401.1 DMT family transporter [Saccharomonospora piscinae]